MNSPVINIKKAVNSAFLLYTVFVLTACSSMPEISAVEPAGWESTIAQKQQIQQWGVKARLGIQSEHEGGSFDLFWDQDDDRYNIRLIAPFGQGAFNIAGNSEAVSIQTNQELTHHSTDPDRLFKEQLGLELPVSSLSSWMLGVPDKRQNLDSVKWDDNGRLAYLEQALWKVEMSRYKPVRKHFLPHFFVLQRDDRPALVIRLLIRQWSLDE